MSEEFPAPPPVPSSGNFNPALMEKLSELLELVTSKCSAPDCEDAADPRIWEKHGIFDAETWEARMTELFQWAEQNRKAVIAASHHLGKWPEECAMLRRRLHDGQVQVGDDWVDAKLADLYKLLKTAGVDPAASCSHEQPEICGHDTQRFGLLFASQYEVQRLVEMLFPNPPRTQKAFNVHRRIFSSRKDSWHFMLDGVWAPVDMEEVNQHDLKLNPRAAWGGWNQFLMGMRVEIPWKDYAWMVKRLQKWLAKQS